MAKISVFDTEATYTSIVFQVSTSDDRVFFAKISNKGIEFFDRTSSSGTPEGNPILKTPDDIFAWIRTEGSKKQFSERKSVQPKKSTASVKPTPKFGGTKQ